MGRHNFLTSAVLLCQVTCLGYLVQRLKFTKPLRQLLVYWESQTKNEYVKSGTQEINLGPY